MGVKSLLTFVVASGLFVGAMLPKASVAAPEPSLVTKSWEFKFTYDTPRAIAVRNLQGEFEWYWFMTYKVVNDTGQENARRKSEQPRDYDRLPGAGRLAQRTRKPAYRLIPGKLPSGRDGDGVTHAASPALSFLA